MEDAAARFWIFQSHPERYDVAERLLPGRTDNWVVSSYANEISRGDVVYLWRAGSEDALYGWAEVTSEVFEAEPARPSRSKADEAPASEADLQLRVELTYRIRFDPPLSRGEISALPELEKLAPLHTAAGTNYPVEQRQVAALNELVRRRGLEAPSDPGRGPEAAPPEQADPVRWERLSPAAQEVLGWAAASEQPNPRVGTRGLLIGLLRLRDLESEPVQLLQYVNRTQEQLFEELQAVRPQPVIDANVAEPGPLTDLPPLTPNGRRALELAFELQSDPAAPVGASHLFGGVLESRSRAYEALERVLRDQIPIERIVETYPAYLASGADTYRAFLDRTLAEREGFEWVSDSPAQRDLLKRRKLAEVVATRLRRLRDVEPGEPEMSFLIHVDGPWGSGKSTLLDFLAEELEKDQDDRWLVVRYDAWRETRVGPPWWTLLVQLREGLTRESGLWERVQLWASEGGRRIRAAGLLYALVAALAIVLLVLIGPDQIMAYVTALAALFGGAAAVSRFFLWDSAKGASVYESSQKNPMDSVSGHFAWLIERSRWPVVFLVDEMDRCSDAQVVDVLDTIQTLIRDAPKKRHETACTAPYFVIAADGAWIRQSYELAHERMAVAVAEPGRPLGYLFLAKIFQLTVTMPSLSPELRSDYLHSLLSRGEPAPEKPEDAAGARASAEGLREKLEASTREDQVLEVLEQAAPETRQALAPLALDLLNAEHVERQTEAHVLDKFGTLLEPNPRAIKRLVIAYGIERSVRTLEGSVVPRDTLVLWTILSTRWPGLGEYLTDRPEAVDCLEKGAVPSDVPPELEPLFKSEAVKEVVNFQSGGPLTKELVAECSGVRLEQPRRPRSPAPHETAS